MIKSHIILYLVRHGESEANKKNYHHTPEVPLSELGISQADLVAKRLKNVEVDLIYSSPAIRAKQTAEKIAHVIHKPIEYWGDLSEMWQPSEIRGKGVDDEEVIKIKEIIKKNKNNENYHFSDEENFKDINERAKKVIWHLENKHSNQKILCVSHSTFIKAIVGRIIFDDLLTEPIFREMRGHMWMKNTGITICEKDPKYGWRLNTWDDSTHV